MRRLACVVTFLFALAVARVAAGAQTPKFTNLYVFGDSYCDVGNVAIATGGEKPGPFYYQGRYSNGPLWVDHIAGYLGLKLTPALAGGTDFAFAGAWVTAPEDGVPTVPQQVQMYLQATGGKADPDALYFLDGGGNDIVGTTSGDPNALGYQIAAGLADSEHMLRNAGARHFIIPNLFNVGLLPVAADHVAFATAASASANQWLNRLLWFDQKLPKLRILRVDVNSLMNAVMKDQSHFGFTDVTGPCLTATGLCADPDHSFFWDVYHPSVFGHAFFAVVIENALAQPTD
ncbi:MAG TPA: SGNH/GDSL hydrolase family protein [Terriglobales bacterium]|nr:SGNH/GDSL hydrolase family protein [Terriglobales bacterium]